MYASCYELKDIVHAWQHVAIAPSIVNHPPAVDKQLHKVILNRFWVHIQQFLWEIQITIPFYIPTLVVLEPYPSITEHTYAVKSFNGLQCSLSRPWGRAGHPARWGLTASPSSSSLPWMLLCLPAEIPRHSMIIYAMRAHGCDLSYKLKGINLADNRMCCTKGIVLAQTHLHTSWIHHHNTQPT